MSTSHESRQSLSELKLSWKSIDLSRYDPETESRVAVLYTGGTIGMKSHENGMVPLMSLQKYERCFVMCFVVGYVPEPDFLLGELRKLSIFHDSTYRQDVFPPAIDDGPLILP